MVPRNIADIPIGGVLLLSPFSSQDTTVWHLRWQHSCHHMSHRCFIKLVMDCMGRHYTLLCHNKAFGADDHKLITVAIKKVFPFMHDLRETRGNAGNAGKSHERPLEKISLRSPDEVYPRCFSRVYELSKYLSHMLTCTHEVRGFGKILAYSEGSVIRAQLVLL